MNPYLDFAQSRKPMPIGTHLVLHEQADPAAARLDGEKLGQVYIDTAHRFKTPLAFPLMDLQVEKEDLLLMLGVSPEKIDTFHFSDEGPTEQELATVLEKITTAPFTPKMIANGEAITKVAKEGDLIPMGMCIGPFSFLTKLLPDPISMLYDAIDAEEDEEEYLAVANTLELATKIILRLIQQQIDADAKAICVCEPACNTVYLSPNQIKEDPSILERFVLRYNKQITERMTKQGVDLVFHDCGELTPEMIAAFGNELKPAVLSLGSSVKLWEAAELVPKSVVLFGNLPSKKFYSDSEYPEDAVKADATEIRNKLDGTGHPYILGSECDVLCVEGCEHQIHRKVDILLQS